MMNKAQTYYRHSTSQWVVQVTGKASCATYTFRYAHKYKCIAKLIYWLSVNADIHSLKP